MLDKIKKRCGIASEIYVYDEEIISYIEDCKADMIASGVPEKLINHRDDGVITAITFYVKAFIGNDRTDTEKYLKLYHRKVGRLVLEDE